MASVLTSKKIEDCFLGEEENKVDNVVVKKIELGKIEGFPVERLELKYAYVGHVFGSLYLYKNIYFRGSFNGAGDVNFEMSDDYIFFCINEGEDPIDKMTLGGYQQAETKNKKEREGKENFEIRRNIVNKIKESGLFLKPEIDLLGLFIRL